MDSHLTGPITSFSNPLVKRVKRLRQKKYRLEEGAFFVEGLRPVLAAVERNAPIETLIVAPDLLTSAVAWDMLRQQAARRPTATVSAEVFTALSERENATGLAAVVSLQWTPVDELPFDPAAIFVAVDQPADPGNLGAILRTCDAAGASGLILTGAAVDPFHPTAVRASMGSLFAVPVAQLPDLLTLLAWARPAGLQVIATSAHASASFWEADYRRPCLLLLGSEGEGLSAEAIAMADVQVTIPMRGTASSLNLAVAAGILLYELARRRQDG
jgi:TrmH family RNA methyltransferase